jgi:hypothetical protein
MQLLLFIADFPMSDVIIFCLGRKILQIFKMFFLVCVAKIICFAIMRHILIEPSVRILAYIVFLLHTLTLRSGPRVLYVSVALDKPIDC